MSDENTEIRIPTTEPETEDVSEAIRAKKSKTAEKEGMEKEKQEKKPQKEKKTKEIVSKKSKVPKIFILIKKTFNDLYNPIKLVILLVVMMILTIILMLPLFPESTDWGALSETQTINSLISSKLIFPMFFWTLGLSFIIIIGISGASQIAEEVSSGSMLILVSKPISRFKIFLGKYIAVYIFSNILGIGAILLSTWIVVMVFTMNFFHWMGMMPFIIANIIYCLVMSFIFVSITMALSSIFKKGRTASLLVLFLAIIIYIAFFMIRSVGAQFYEPFFLYHFDLGYHLANIYIWFLELFNAVPDTIGWQSFFLMMFGVYKSEVQADVDQGIALGGYEKTGYYDPFLSLLVWLAIAGLLLLYGLLSLKKREISN